MVYEILSIIPAKFSDDEVEGVVERVAKLVTAAGCQIERTDNLGKIKLAYPIDHMRYGTYILMYVAAPATGGSASGGETSVMKKVDQDLRLSDDVLRHMIVAHPEGIPKFTPKLSSYVPPLNAEGRRSGEKSDDRPRPPKVVQQGEDKPLSAVELDKKLDEILDSDIMKSI